MICGPFAVRGDRFLNWEDAFFSNVLVADGCWGWGSAMYPTGYSPVRFKGKQKMAHRVSYEIFIGPIPDGMFVLHRCDNRQCTNPDHLFLGTQADNISDMMGKGRNYQSNKIKCIRGHSLSEAHVTKKGHRQCQECRRERHEEKIGRKVGGKRVTHCPAGHEYSPENTSIRRGKRNCKTCHREYQAVYRKKQLEVCH